MVNRFLDQRHIDGIIGAFVIGLGLFILACAVVGLSVVLAAIAELVN